MVDVYPEPYSGIYHPTEVEYELMFISSRLEGIYKKYNSTSSFDNKMSRRSWFQFNIAASHAAWRDEFNRRFVEPEQEIFPITTRKITILSIKLFEQNKQYVSESTQLEINEKLQNAKLKYDILDEELV